MLLRGLDGRLDFVIGFLHSVLLGRVGHSELVRAILLVVKVLFHFTVLDGHVSLRCHPLAGLTIGQSRSGFGINRHFTHQLS